MPCSMKKYTMSDLDLAHNLNVTRIKINFEDPSVEYLTSYVNYDIQNLVGELGGTIGMFLGFSCLSVTKYLIQKSLRILKMFL